MNQRFAALRGVAQHLKPDGTTRWRGAASERPAQRGVKKKLLALGAIASLATASGLLTQVAPAHAAPNPAGMITEVRLGTCPSPWMPGWTPSAADSNNWAIEVYSEQPAMFQVTITVGGAGMPWMGLEPGGSGFRSLSLSDLWGAVNPIPDLFEAICDSGTTPSITVDISGTSSTGPISDQHTFIFDPATWPADGIDTLWYLCDAVWGNAPCAPPPPPPPYVPQEPSSSGDPGSITKISLGNCPTAGATPGWLTDAADWWIEINTSGMPQFAFFPVNFVTDGFTSMAYVMLLDDPVETFRVPMTLFSGAETMMERICHADGSEPVQLIVDSPAPGGQYVFDFAYSPANGVLNSDIPGPIEPCNGVWGTSPCPTTPPPPPTPPTSTQPQSPTPPAPTAAQIPTAAQPPVADQAGRRIPRPVSTVTARHLVGPSVTLSAVAGSWSGNPADLTGVGWIPGEPVAISITAPDGSVIKVATVMADRYGKFSLRHTKFPKLSVVGGTYTLTAVQSLKSEHGAYVRDYPRYPASEVSRDRNGLTISGNARFNDRAGQLRVEHRFVNTQA